MTTALLECGSLQSRSFNRSSLEVVEEHLTGPGVSTDGPTDLGRLQPFNLDHQDEPGTEVTAFRESLANSDAVVIATPEYAAALPGMLKNALDWIVGSAELYSKPIAVVSAGTTGGEHVRSQLVRTLIWQGGHVVASLAIAAPMTKADASGQITDPSTLEQLRGLAGTIAGAPTMTAAALRKLIEGIAAQTGVEPGHVAPIPGEQSASHQ